MRKSYYLFSLVGMVFVLSACAENKTRIGEGAGIGGVLGAAAGGIIGHQSGRGVEGALIGGAVGAAGGAVVGAQIEKPKKDAAATTEKPLTMQDVVDLTKKGASSDDIITKIKASNPKYSLTADDLEYLRKEGVSQRVIETMQACQ